MAEYSNPQGMLEYLSDVTHLLGMAAVHLSRFPYLGVGGQGTLEEEEVFHTFTACEELASALIAATSG